MHRKRTSSRTGVQKSRQTPTADHIKSIECSWSCNQLWSIVVKYEISPSTSTFNQKFDSHRFEFSIEIRNFQFLTIRRPKIDYDQLNDARHVFRFQIRLVFTDCRVLTKISKTSSIFVTSSLHRKFAGSSPTKHKIVWWLSYTISMSLLIHLFYNITIITQRFILIIKLQGN